MPKIPLYNQQSSIGTAQGVTINPQYAVNLASAQSQNDELRVFQDVLGMGEEFVKEYKKNKYDSDMAKSKKLEAEFQNDAKIGWVEAQTKGQTATEFKNDGLAKLKADYNQRYSEAGFFGDSLVDAQENFNIKYAEEEKSVDLNIANEALAKQIQHYEDSIYTAIEENNPVALKQHIASLTKIKGKDYAEQIATEKRTENFLEKQQREQELEQFNNVYNDAVLARTRAVDAVETVSKQMKAYQEQTEIFNDNIDKLVELNPKYTEELEQLRKDFVRQGRSDILFGTMATNAEEYSKNAEKANLITQLDQLNGETDLEKRNINFQTVKQINAILHKDNKEEELDANREYEQEGQYVEAHSILSTTSNYNEFNTEWKKVEKANEEGRYTAGQYVQLQVLKRAADNREHNRVFVTPSQEILKNPKDWPQSRINNLEGITEEQRNTLIRIQKSTINEALFEEGLDSPQHYSYINNLIYDLRIATLKGYFAKRYDEAKTDQERESIKEEASTYNVNVTASDYDGGKNVTEDVDKILEQIYKTRTVNNKEVYILPENLILDLSTSLYSIAGDKKTYSSEINPISRYEHTMYRMFKEHMLPAIQSMSPKAQVNAIAHMRKQMGEEVERILGKKPVAPTNNRMEGTYTGGMLGTTVGFSDSKRSQRLNSRYQEKLLRYQEQGEEWQQSDHGIHEFLAVSLFPMLDDDSVNLILNQVRDNTSLMETADEVYGQ